MAENPKLVVSNETNAWKLTLYEEPKPEIDSQIIITPDGSIGMRGFTSYSDPLARMMYETLVKYIEAQGHQLPEAPNHNELYTLLVSLPKIDPFTLNPRLKPPVLLRLPGDPKYNHPEDFIMYAGRVRNIEKGTDQNISPISIGITLGAPLYRIVGKHYNMQRSQIAYIRKVESHITFPIERVITSTGRIKTNPPISNLDISQLDAIYNAMTYRNRSS